MYKVLCKDGMAKRAQAGDGSWYGGDTGIYECWYDRCNQGCGIDQGS